MNFGLFSAALLCVILVKVKAQTTCLTTVKEGQLKGIEFTPEKKYCAFMGIPFAEPPVGEQRFRPPRPPKPWKGLRDATREGDMCKQPLQLLMRAVGSEDCLYLNVYTPDDFQAPGNKLHAVLVWIAPGEFYFENSFRNRNQPDYFLEHDMIVVSFNYRVGAFGFLSTEDDEAPGNYGMKDQVAALHWVHENIESFGGDPNSVTIAGISSGAASVHYLMLSPLARGLFQKAICQEGTALMPWARHRNPAVLAKKQARIVGCPEEPSSELVSCLRNMDADILTQSIYKLFLFWIIPSPDYTPVVEKKTDRNPEPFITDDPIKLVANGEFARVPWLIGSNSQPATIITAALFSIKIIKQQARTLNNKFLPEIMMLHKSISLENATGLLEKIRLFYNLSRTFVEDEQQSWTNLLSDRYFTHGAYKAVRLHASLGHHPIYNYHFAYKGMFSVTLEATLKNYGVGHSDELYYLFHNGVVHPSDDNEVKDLLVTLWTNFMKYGNPTPPNIDSSQGSYLMKHLKWEPVGKLSDENMHVRYLNIGQVITSPGSPSIFLNQNLGAVKLNMAHDLLKYRMDFWDSLPFFENIKPHIQSQGSCMSVNILIITLCLCLWSSVYY